MKKFEVGKNYSCTSACNHECVWTFKVIKRTDKTVTLQQSGKSETITRRPYLYDDSENIRPLGNYSMAPIIRA